MWLQKLSGVCVVCVCVNLPGVVGDTHPVWWWREPTRCGRENLPGAAGGDPPGVAGETLPGVMEVFPRPPHFVSHSHVFRVDHHDAVSAVRYNNTQHHRVKHVITTAHVTTAVHVTAISCRT